MSTTSSKSSSIEFVVVTPDPNNETNGRLKLVEQLHGDLMLRTFDDLEEVDIWKRISLTAPRDLAANDREYAMMAFVVATCPRSLLDDKAEPSKSAGERVVCGGVSVEIYKKSRWGFLGYLSVEPACRNMGIARNLVLLGQQVADKMCRENLSAPMKHFAMLVAQGRDEHDDKKGSYLCDAFDPLIRQQIWTKMGFLPLALDIVCPGRLKGHRHQLAVQHDLLRGAVETTFPSEEALEFLEDLFSGILAEEGNTTDKQGEIAALRKQLLEGPPDVPCGSTMWL